MGCSPDAGRHSARCIFAQMPAISIWAAVHLSRSSIIHEQFSTDRTLVCNSAHGGGPRPVPHVAAVVKLLHEVGRGC
jgi:hypothetical protein